MITQQYDLTDLRAALDRAREDFESACGTQGISRQQFDEARSAYLDANKAFYTALEACGGVYRTPR